MDRSQYNVQKGDIIKIRGAKRGAKSSTERKETTLVFKREIILGREFEKIS